MGVVNVNTIKNWFKYGLIPTQSQFWDWIDSYRHKSDKVPVGDIEGIDGVLLAKADKEAFTNHLSDALAHTSAFNARELLNNKVDNVSANLGSSTKYPSIKGIIDWIYANVYNTPFLGAAVIGVAPTGTGNAYWITTEAGTYPLYGGVVVNSNSIAVIIRSSGGGFSVSQSAFDFSDYAKTDKLINKADLVVGKNLFNKNASGIINGSYIGAAGFLQTNAIYYVSDYIPVLPSTTYVHSNFAIGGALCAVYDVNKTFISTFNSTSITIPSNGYFVRMSGTIANKSIQQFELGNASTSYEAYGLRVNHSQLIEYAKIVELPSVVNPLVALKADLILGKNLFNKNASGITEGSYIGAAGFLQTNAIYYVSDYIPVLPNTTYIHSNFQIGGALCAIYDLNKTFISTFNTLSITIPSNGYFVRMSGTVVNKSIQQFELGTASTSYEAYGFKVTPSQLPAQVSYANKIACPLKQHFLTTIENNIYLTEFQKRVLPSFILDTTSTIGLRKNDIIRALNPTAGSYSVTNALVDLDYADVMRKNYTVIVTDLSKTTPINVLSIGDSYTDIGSYVKKMGQTIPNINHVGMCKTLAGTDVKREGRSGWTLAQYMTQTGSTAGTSFFSPFLHPVAPYTYYGNTDFWKKVFVGTAPSYEIDTFKPWLTTLNINSSGVRATPTVNDVMYFSVDSAYKYWNGTVWTVITASALNFTFNFSKYLTTWNVATPDVITILLGMNDFRSIVPTAFDAFFIGWKANLDAFITNVKLANSNMKIVIATCNSTEYNDLSGKANAAIWEGYNAVINAYDNREAEKIYISDTKASVDRVLGFSGTRAIPFSNYTGSETIWLTQGDVHLNTAGMNQIGEKLAATIQYIRP